MKPRNIDAHDGLQIVKKGENMWREENNNKSRRRRRRERGGEKRK